MTPPITFLWRNGIRMGFAWDSHGMACPGGESWLRYDPAECKGDPQPIEGKWRHIQEIIRAAPKTLITYQNNEDPNRSNQAIYTIRVYLDLTVKEF